MSKIRAQVVTRKAGDLAIDHVVNVVHFDDFNIDPTAGTDWQSIANSIRGVFQARAKTPVGYGVEVKVYDMADALPRPIKATAAWAASTSTGGIDSPREVACCLSYYSERNLPRFRGRLYIGPFTDAGLRPASSSHIAAVKGLATGLAGVGGPDVDWGLWSPTRGAFSKITNVWVDDEWDTVRSRGLRATTREPMTTGE